MNINVKLPFLNRWESWIFGKRGNEHYNPSSSIIGRAMFWASCMFAITAIVLNFSAWNLKSTIIAGSIIFGCVFLVATWMVFDNINTFTGAGVKVGYVSYIFALFVVGSAIFVALAFAVLAIITIYLCLRFVLWIAGWNSSGGGKGSAWIHYSDGSSEKATKETGLFGDTTFKGDKTGNEVDL
jgi:hypothetical protein